MKRILFLSFCLLWGSLLMANPVSPERARQVAYQFSRLAAPDGAVLTVTDVVDVSASTAYQMFYTFSLGEKGFVMVSGDDRAVPILGYGFNNPICFKDVPAQIASWLNSYERQLEWLRDNDVPISDVVMMQWRSLESGSLPMATVPSSVSPLIVTTWDQNPYYNSLCPGSGTGSNRAVTGCVATATAQVMKFWSHPATGRGSHGYTDPNYGYQSANFGNTSYQWSSMPNSLNGASSSTQVNAVATLMYHVGVAVEMEYGTSAMGGSGAAMQCYGSASVASSEQALVSYFRYQPTVHCISMADYTDAQWTGMLRAELDEGRPIIYEGDDEDAGHCFVCDGYDNSNRFHFNWGWGGSYDGYYAIGSLNLGGGGTGSTSSYTFNLRNGALCGIQPMTTTAGSTTTITSSSNNNSYGSVTGTGTFNSFTDTVSLTAEARAGYRFESWSDGYRHNPREFIAPGGNHSFSAIFAPIAGDTITYCTSRIIAQTAIGSTTTWGIRIPANSLVSGSSLSKVRFYVPSAGTYTLTIYKGSNTPTTQLYSGSFSTSVATGWSTCDLSTPVSVDASSSLFVTISSSASYPAAYTYYCGNDDGSWMKYGGSWMYLGGVTWSIKAIFTNGSPTGPYTITAISNNDNWGSVTGSGTYAAGTTVWLEAVPRTGYHFVHWNDGNTSARRQITVMTNATYTAIFASDNGDDCSVSAFPWSENFDGDLDCWSILDADGDGYSWQQNGRETTHSGSGNVASASYINDVGALNPDNWIISPRINLPSQSAQIEWWEYGDETDDFAEHYGLYVSTSGTDPSCFTPLWVGTVPSAKSWRKLTQSLNAYCGQTVYIAFRHFNCSNMYWLILDDVKVSGSGNVGVDVALDEDYHVWTEGRTIVIGGAAQGRVTVYDVLGRTVASLQLSTDAERVTVSQSGFYFISVNGTTTQRVVVL